MPEEKNEAAEDELDENAEFLPNREVMSMITPPGDPTYPVDPSGGEGVASPEEAPSAG
jgi:hypothetical protein